MEILKMSPVNIRYGLSARFKWTIVGNPVQESNLMESIFF
jgi:hypothetical protein